MKKTKTSQTARPRIFKLKELSRSVINSFENKKKIDQPPKKIRHVLSNSTIGMYEPEKEPQSALFPKSKKEELEIDLSCKTQMRLSMEGS